MKVWRTSGQFLKALNVLGMIKNELQERLLRKNVTLDKMVSFCRASGVAGRIKIIKTGNQTAKEVDIIKVPNERTFLETCNSHSLKTM